MSKINRRDFLKGIGVAGTALGLANVNTIADVLVRDYRDDEAERPYARWNVSENDAVEWTMVIDLAKCDGCQDLVAEGKKPRCTQACIDGHYTPDEFEFIKVFEVVDEHTEKQSFFPRPCQQCKNPPCAHVCPVGAAWQRDGDRLTLIDQTRCIGCRLCMVGCPYEVRFFNFERNPKADDIPDSMFESQMPFGLNKEIGVISKCEFCGLQYTGQLTHCTQACHVGAIYFGDKHENVVTNGLGESLPLDELLAKKNGYRWKEEEGTNPRVFYLPPVEDL
ncbi:MAG: 4Fe-4S dicluster domain-containing protein [Candidatus Heimdallarchaeota archaeon]|nr:4Fe-4S dicluster domain-containing protein [Candidatus Heimdallarchaeota archaeon]